MNDLLPDSRVACVRVVKLPIPGFDKRMWPKQALWRAEVDRGLDQVFRAPDARTAWRQAQQAFPNAKVIG